MGPVTIQFEQFRQKYPAATLQERPDGSAVISVPEIPIDDQRWSKSWTTVHFVAPVGYPAAKPDCFWTDGDLRLKNGTMPQNAGNQPLPGITQPTLWFSWHAASWNVNIDNLRTYLRVIEDRLARAQ
jgi:Prokaryotic E2 family E